jgi:hypothetical protein
LNKSIVSGADENVLDYLSFFIKEIAANGDNYAYKDFKKPLFRGIPKKSVDIERDY